MLSLPNVTLVIIDSVNESRALVAVDKCLSVCKFGSVKTLFDLDLKTIEQYSEFMLRGLKWFIKTDFALVIQWDGFIINPSAWDPKFLHYDYIGAPWWYINQHNVGNGGFSLRSKKLLEATANPDILPLHPEDDSIRQNADLLSRKYGIQFAPESLAARFSWEENGKFPVYKGSFGFHGASNVDRFL